MSNKQNNVLREQFIEQLDEDLACRWANSSNPPSKILAQRYPKGFEAAYNEWLDQLEAGFGHDDFMGG